MVLPAALVTAWKSAPLQSEQRGHLLYAQLVAVLQHTPQQLAHLHPIWEQTPQ